MRQRRRVPTEFRNPSFPIGVRGYDRDAVDRYVARVNRVIAELEATHSPEAAISHALREAEEQTRGMLEEASQRAREIIAAARGDADALLAGAKAEAADIVVNASTEADRANLEADAYRRKAAAEADEQLATAKAEAEAVAAEARREADESLQRSRDEVAAVREKAEAWANEFMADTQAIWKERGELLADVRELAARLAAAAMNAAARLPADDPAEGSKAREPRTE